MRKSKCTQNCRFRDVPVQLCIKMDPEITGTTAGETVGGVIASGEGTSSSEVGAMDEAL